MEKGILYIATGSRCERETLVSIRSVRAVMPEIPIAIFSDWIPSLEDDHLTHYPIEEPHFHYLDKVRHFAESPFERTLFLDTDTFVTGPLDEVFALLDRFEMAGAHELSREHDRLDLPPAGRAFPEINTGVLAWRRCPAVTALFEDLRATYEPRHRDLLGDQTAFRPCLYRSEVRFCVLPPEFNCQIRQIGFVNGPVKIVHGRNIDLEKVARRINRKPDKRVYLASPFRGIRILHFSHLKMKLWSAWQVALRKLKPGGGGDSHE